jgi:hypothetical protein
MPPSLHEGILDQVFTYLAVVSHGPHEHVDSLVIPLDQGLGGRPIALPQPLDEVLLLLIKGPLTMQRNHLLATGMRQSGFVFYGLYIFLHGFHAARPVFSIQIAPRSLNTRLPANLQSRPADTPTRRAWPFSTEADRGV